LGEQPSGSPAGAASTLPASLALASRFPPSLALGPPSLVPPLSLLVGIQGAAVGAAALVACTRGRRSDRRQLAIAAAGGAIVVGHVVAGLLSVRAPLAVYRSLLGAPRAIAWKLGLLAGVISRPDDVGWTRTARNAETSR